MDAKVLKSRAILVVRHGSHAYGLNTAQSDLDIKGVLFAERDHYLGYLNRVEQIEEREPNDLVIYEFTKFFKLASDCNPNIIEILFTDEADTLFINGFGEELRLMRKLFLSQKAKHTFSGYAMAQLKRMKNHHAWMKNPPTAPKTREELGLPQNKNWVDALESQILKGNVNPQHLPAEEHAMLHKERDWRKASEAFANYKEWLAGRNEKRHELEAKFGYDTKHGMHLVRLMRMGHEILTEGKVIVKRPDREELLAIRNNGIWSYEQIVEYAEKMDKQLTEIYTSGKSPLPKEPERRMLDIFCVTAVQRALDNHMMWGKKCWDGTVK